MSSDLAKKMPYNRLGRSGLRVSKLSYGAWVTFGTQIGIDEAFALMKKAYESGVNLFDNAETYASGEAEVVMGECVQRGIKEKLWERSDLILTTKIFFGSGRKGANATGLSRKHIVEGLQDSLKRFQLDYVDIVFCHRPDPLTPIEETVRAMNHVIDRGMAFYWGTSEWSATELTEAWRVADRLGLIGPIVEQPQYNMFSRERVEVEFQPIYEGPGLGLTTWSPLSSGILTGKYSGGKVPEGSRMSTKGYEWLRELKLEKNKWQIEAADKLKPIADDLGCSQAQLAVAWCARNENVTTVLLGATKMHQLEDNLGALEVLPKLTQEVMDKIDEILGNKPKPHQIHQDVLDFRKYPAK